MTPMLLPRQTPDLDTLQYPVYVTPKLDGIRCLIKEGVALSRTLKPIPNKSIQVWAKKYSNKLNGMDGELIVGLSTSPTVYRDTNSFVMSHEKEGEFYFYHFDWWNEPFHYEQRVEGYIRDLPSNYRKVMHMKATDPAHVLQLEEQCLEQGYEGVILRNPKGLYKYGRCTLKEANAFKLKRFEDDEATIIGFEEEMHNGNNAEINELGRTKRSTSLSGLSGKESLGAFICTTSNGTEFKIGSGFDSADRKLFWINKQNLLGHIVKYKHFPVGRKLAPRHPIFLGFRDPIDM